MRLRAIATVLEFQRGNATIFSEGEDAHFVYSVASGVVRLSRHTESGRRQIIALMLPGDLFGMPEEGIYVNTSETVCPATLYRLPWLKLQNILNEEQEMQNSLLVRLAYDLRQAQKRILMLGQQNITQRLAAFLLELCQHSDFFDKHTRVLYLPITRYDLADYLGTSPETVVRVLAKLESAKIIRRLSPKQVELLDQTALQKMLSVKRRSPNSRVSR
jgi:CRP-like cAMP-binding protein